MARMFPPELKDVDGASPPEQEVFRHLGRELDDSWNVYYSQGLKFPDDGKGKTLAEIDFLLTHPVHGVVTIEVKGTVRRIDGRWQTSEGKRWRDIPDPGHQARDHEMNARRLFKDRFGWPVGKQRVVPVLVLTGSRVGDLDLAPDLPEEQVIDSVEVVEDVHGNIIRAIEAETAIRDKTEPLGSEGVEKIHEILAGNFDLTPTLADEIAREEAQLKRLTNQQKKILAGLPAINNAVIRGCAGSGKTMLARDLALEQANEGLDVLFICFNYQLSLDLEKRGMGGKVHVRNFHRFCREMAEEAGLEVPSEPTKDDFEEFEDFRAAQQAHFAEKIPELAYEATELVGRRFDVLIVDEAQDLKPDWYETLRSWLKPDGKTWLFLDDNQQVYESGFEVPDGFTPFHLTENCRNTQAIHEEFRQHYEGPIPPQSFGPVGRPIERIAADEGQPRAVAKAIERLVNKEKIAAQDIVVLSPHRIEPSGRSKLSKVANSPGKFGYSRTPTTKSDQVHFTSIKAFKGMESPVVIVCELDDITHERAREETYVAFSRAKNHLIVVGPEGSERAS